MGRHRQGDRRWRAKSLPFVKDQFQIWTYDFLEKGGNHPCVLISHPDICARAQFVNVLYCTSQRQNRPPKHREIVLDVGDGLEWESFCDCGQLFVAESAKLFDQRGLVTLERRNASRDKIRDIFRLAARD